MTSRPSRMLMAMLLVAAVFAGGCVRRRVVLVPPGEPIQLAESVKAHVYVTADGPTVCRVPSTNRSPVWTPPLTTRSPVMVSPVRLT